MTSDDLSALLESLAYQPKEKMYLLIELAKLLQLETIAKSLADISLDLHDSEGEPYGALLVRHLKNLTELNTHPGFEALEQMASTLKTIQRVGLPIERV